MKMNTRTLYILNLLLSSVKVSSVINLKKSVTLTNFYKSVLTVVSASILESLVGWKEKKWKTIEIQISKWAKSRLLSIRNHLEEACYRPQQWKLEISMSKIHLPVTLGHPSIYSSGNLPSSIIKILIDISRSKARDDVKLNSYEMSLNMNKYRIWSN